MLFRHPGVQRCQIGFTNGKNWDFFRSDFSTLDDSDTLQLQKDLKDTLQQWESINNMEIYQSKS